MRAGASALRILVRASLALVIAAVVPTACTSNSAPPSSTLAGACAKNSDCSDPLVCVFAKCHDACATSRDCSPGSRCMASDKPFHVCQLPSETRCSRTSDCPDGQLCAADFQCRDECRVDRDCVSGQTCFRGACAEPAEIDAGLAVLPDAGLDATVGVPCEHKSDCPTGLACRAGLCSFECLTNRDCVSGASCVDHVCHASACSPDGGPAGGDVCQLDSDCLSPLVCRANRCTCQCRVSSDCGSRGLSCDEGRCVAVAVTDAGADASDASDASDAADASDASDASDAAADGGILMTGGVQLSPVANLGRSTNYVLVYSVGDQVGNQVSLSWPGFRIRGGGVGSNGSVP